MTEVTKTLSDIEQNVPAASAELLPLPLDANQATTYRQDPDLLELDESLTRLAVERPKLARLVSLRYFGGLTMDQAAKALQVSRRTAERDRTYAKVWLLDAMRAERGSPWPDKAVFL